MVWKSTFLVLLMGVAGTMSTGAPPPKPIPIWFVDAFTINGNSPFTGNNYAIIMLDYDDDLSDEMKLKVASELNLPATAYVSYGWKNGQNASGSSDHDHSHAHLRTIRWFTPTFEMPFCGAATFSAAKAIVETQLQESVNDPNLKTIEFAFLTKSKGTFDATYDKETGKIAVSFPALQTEAIDKKKHTWVDEMIKTALGKHVPPSAVSDVRYIPGPKTLMLRLDNANMKDVKPTDLLKKVAPNFYQMRNIDTGGMVVYLYCHIKGEAGGGDDATKDIPHFYSRWFGVGEFAGYDEDPACGLAHTILTPYWHKELSAGGATVGSMLGSQLSKRGGKIVCTLVGDKVQLAGDARVTIKGHIFL